MYSIAIPSHMRLDLLQKYTLPLLKRHNIDSKGIFIFASPASYKDYKAALSHEYTVIKSYASILRTRNHIISKFEEGAQVVEIDDDIEEVISLLDSKPIESIHGLITYAFEKSKGGLWGISATTDPRMAEKRREGFGLRSIVNSFLGYTNNKDIKLSLKEKEDFERTILFWKKGLPIYKIPQYGIKTKYWTNKGGIQSHYNKEHRKAVQKKAADVLFLKYPELVYKRTRRNGIVDIRFRKALEVKVENHELTK
jgi:hypothetical protein